MVQMYLGSRPCRVSSSCFDDVKLKSYALGDKLVDGVLVPNGVVLKYLGDVHNLFIVAVGTQLVCQVPVTVVGRLRSELEMADDPPAKAELLLSHLKVGRIRDGLPNHLHSRNGRCLVQE